MGFNSGFKGLKIRRKIWKKSWIINWVWSHIFQRIRDIAFGLLHSYGGAIFLFVSKRRLPVCFSTGEAKRRLKSLSEGEGRALRKWLQRFVSRIHKSICWNTTDLNFLRGKSVHSWGSSQILRPILNQKLICSQQAVQPWRDRHSHCTT